MHFDHLMRKVREAAATGIGCMSSGEALCAALVLNRPDWLQELDFTIAEALDKIGSDTIALLRQAERTLNDENDLRQQAEETAAVTAVAAEILKPKKVDATVRLSSELITFSHAPGYRDVFLEFDVQVVDPGDDAKKHRIELSIRPDDAEEICDILRTVHQFAWKTERGPIDKKEGETKPTWVCG